MKPSTERNTPHKTTHPTRNPTTHKTKRSVFSGLTRGEGVLQRAFARYGPYRGPIQGTRKGAIVSTADGKARGPGGLRAPSLLSRGLGVPPARRPLRGFGECVPTTGCGGATPPDSIAPKGPPNQPRSPKSVWFTRPSPLPPGHAVRAERPVLAGRVLCGAGG